MGIAPGAEPIAGQVEPPIASHRTSMVSLVESFDWAATELGPREAWPQSLRTAVGICLASRYPMAIWWGPEGIQIYNDGYIHVLGGKHPRALGQRADECWAETWHVVS